MGRLLLISILFIALAAPAASKPILIAVCEEPEGPRIDYGGMNGQEWSLEISTDKYTGVHPVFIINDETPNNIIVYWGNTKKYDNQLSEDFKKFFKDLMSTKAWDAQIIHVTDSQISAIRLYDTGLMLYSLFPKRKMGYFTYHDNQSLFGMAEYTVTATFHACHTSGWPASGRSILPGRRLLFMRACTIASGGIFIPKSVRPIGP